MYSMRIPTILSDYLEENGLKEDVWVGDMNGSELFSTAEKCLRSAEFCKRYSDRDIESLREFIPCDRYGNFSCNDGYWISPDSFGSSYPPANLDEIILEGDELVERHGNDPEFPSKLYERWFVSGKLPRRLRLYSVIADINDELWVLDTVPQKREAERIAKNYAKTYEVVVYVFAPGGEAYLADATKFDGRN